MDRLTVGLVASFVLLLSIVWVMKMIVAGIRRKGELQILSNLHDKLLDRFKTGEELKELMQSEAADKLYQSITGAKDGAHLRILAALQAGTVLSLLGVALVLLGGFHQPDEGLFMVFGVLFLGLGLGFLLSSGVSYRLSKKWGLISPPHGVQRQDD